VCKPGPGGGNGLPKTITSLREKAPTAKGVQKKRPVIRIKPSQPSFEKKYSRREVRRETR